MEKCCGLRVQLITGHVTSRKKTHRIRPDWRPKWPNGPMRNCTVNTRHLLRVFPYQAPDFSSVAKRRGKRKRKKRRAERRRDASLWEEPSLVSLPLSFQHHLRLLSTATPEAPSPASSSQFAANYLIQSFGLSSDKATSLSRYLPYLKSQEKPDAVLQFLRLAGVSEPDISAAVSRDPRFLCYSVEKCLKPRMTELLEIGFSPSDISLLLSICPNMFSRTKLQQKIQFWMHILGSIEKLLIAFKRDMFLLNRNHENYVMLNISFLQEQCSLSVCQIAKMIVASPTLIACRPKYLEIKVKRANELGFSCSSGAFWHALVVVNCLNQNTIDARLLDWKNLGLSQEEVSLMIGKAPYLLRITEKMVGRILEFLMKEAACDKLHIVQNPALLMYSLEKRLNPRNIVRMLLKSKGFPAANLTFAFFVMLTEKQFVKKFVLPYENTFPRLHQAYVDACSGKTATR